MKTLENQLADLEGESEKLLQSFEAQKTLTAEAEALIRKKTEESARELAQRVRRDAPHLPIVLN